MAPRKRTPRPRKRAIDVPSPSSSGTDSDGPASSNSSDEDTHECTCGCGRPVTTRTEARHWANKAENAAVSETTKAAFRNAAPGPSFKGAKAATKRGGSRSKDARPLKRAKTSEHRDADAPSPARDAVDTAPAVSPATQSSDQTPILDEEPMILVDTEPQSNVGEESGDMEEVEGRTASGGSGNAEEGMARPHIEENAAKSYRATVSEELEGIADLDVDGSATSSESGDSDSDSDSDTRDVLDVFSDSENDDTAWAQLGDMFEARVAALAAVDGLPEEDLDILLAFSFQVEQHISRGTYQSMPDYFPDLELDTYESNRARMRQLSGISSTTYDCCQNSCVLFVGRHASLDKCPECSSARYDDNGRAVHRFSYLPLIPRLRAMFYNAESSKRQLYRDQATKEHKDGHYCDVFDGEHYRNLLSKHVRIDGEEQTHKYFSDMRDLALGLFTDGFGPFKKRKQTCWPLLLVNYNLDPEVRYRQENVICLGVIPGPKQPTDFNSFLYPLVQELLQLAGGVRMFDGNTRSSFILHAYLLLACGDMPAVAKMMCMKGHSGLYSCRFCKIRGVHIPGARGNALYTPLDRSTHPDAGNPLCYDPYALPLRTHEEMLQQALQVETATKTRAQTLSRDSGINETPILACLPSVRLDMSFPVEFMHLVWLNLIPNLVLLYSGKYKDLPQGSGLYEFAAAVWEQIGKTTAASGSTMPSAFGARVPNLAKDKTYMIAETWCIWALYIAPVVLRGRFVQEKYYNHFMELVRLLRICVQLEITDADVQEIREGFCKWVQKFEKYFYQYDPERLSTCVSTVHGLLHIADSIKKMGPVGCYWSFLMERFCSSLRPAITSRRNPYASIDRYVFDCTLLKQVRLFNNLNGRNRPFHEQKRPVTKKEYHTPSYPASVLMRPQRVVPLAKADRDRIARHLSVRFGANAKTFLPYVPEQIEAWGKVRRLDDGDTVHARGIVKLRRTDRDMSFVRYALEEDKYKNQPKRKPEFVRKEYFGQLQYIYILPLPALPKYKQREPQTLLLACVTDCAGLSQPNSVGVRYYSGKMGTSQVIDLASVECVIGRVEDRGQVAIIDRSNEFSRVIIPEDDE